MATISEQEMLRTYRETFPAVALMVRNLGGSLESAKDLFHDALLIYFEKQSAGSLEINVSERSYLKGIVRNLWNRQFRNRLFTTSLDESDEEELYYEENRQSEFLLSTSLLHFLKTAGKKCMQLLQAYYYDQQSMKEIAVQFHFSSARSATVQKFKCLEKLREQLKTSALYEESFA
ncbi:RNA polymerase sigma factor [Pseudoflavitalea rhizosphaerae]|uniref:RNA polymerase sigma factor n=1 Tax=Pseudoflavitalea rhizosphaerae TaxID=1884793 RepID=UPI000F8CB73A|nr:sigma-70 family RNA polymerase sigma factor [Pseudoflavitalea rhizosphaerae]